MAYDLIKISALPAATPDESQEIVVGVGDYAKRINYGDVKADMVGTSPSYTTDTEPYLMRQTAHTGIVGKCALNKLVGGSLGWNQLVQNGNFTETSGWYAIYGDISVSNNECVYTITNQDSSFVTSRIQRVVNIVSGHKYLVLCGLYPTKSGTTRIRIQNNSYKDYSQATVNSWNDLYAILDTSSGGSLYIQLSHGGSSYVINDSYKWRNVRISDLTALFGSTIADYVYGLEQATAGAGVAWLSKYIDLSTYHAHDSGSIQSVQATAHVVKDANNNVIGNYPLGSDTLRGYPMLVNNKLAFDGDEKYPDGTIRRRYGTVDLGTLTYSYNATYGMNAVLPSDAATPIISGREGVCGRYTLFQGTSTNFATLDKVFTFCNNNMSSQKRIFIRDSAYTDAATFKTAMSGVYFVYPLETETTESSTAFQKIQTIDADGTESFTTSSPVPVGHETQTADNILAALGWLGE